jgi:hypothetical protein
VTDDLGKLIRDRVEAAIRKARLDGPVNVASATNVDEEGHTTAAFADDEVTIVQRDGKTWVNRRRDAT